MKDRLPVAIIGGFLGAGKTTLINRLLTAEGAARTAVLVNDFGAVNIDQRLIAGQNAQVLTLANGCLCCALQNDLVAQVEELIRQRGPELSRIVIETSGVADPGRVVRTLAYPQLRHVVCVSSVITLLDATRFAQLTGPARELADVQLSAADAAVLTKTDVAPPAMVEPLREYCRSLGVRCLNPASVASLYTALFGDGAPPGQAPQGQGQQLSAIAPADSTFESWSFSELRPLSLQHLRRVLAALPQEIYRAKGFVFLEEAPDSECIVQAVGERVEFTRAAAGREEGAHGILVFIGLRGRVDWRALEIRLRGCVAGDVGLPPLRRPE